MTAASSQSAVSGYTRLWLSITAIAALSAIVALLSEPLPAATRVVLVIAVVTILSWALAVTEEWRVGAIAIAALWISGAITGADIMEAATNDLILLLVAAFVIAHVVERSGLLSVIAARLLSSPMSFSALCWRLSAIVGLTAFLIPSTSARAAMFLPLHRAVLTTVEEGARRRALALLTPTVILLSAGGVLTGAAAHILALDLIATSGRSAMSYGRWLLFAAPVAIASTAAAVWLILHLVAEQDAVDVRATPTARQSMNAHDFAVLTIIAATIGLWMTAAWHGVSLAAIGAAAAAFMLLLDRRRQHVRIDALFYAIDVKILVLLVSTILLAKAMMASGSLEAMFGFFKFTASGSAGGPLFATAVIAAIAILAHLIIPSRSARAAVLLPSLALPMANAGADIAAIALVVVLGTGFCQLVPYGAKPLMIFSRECEPDAFRSDLRRVGFPLAVATWGILVACAMVLWPLLGISTFSGGE